MLCDRCQQNPASVHMTSVINNQRQEHHLCAKCAEQQGLLNTPALSLQELLSGFFASNPPSTTTTTACPRCGMTYQQFRSLGRLGCVDCYTAFDAQLKPMLRRIHGTAQHSGKTAKVSGELLQKRRELDNLRALMQDAITAEDFEQAAQLRDQIREMESGKE